MSVVSSLNAIFPPELPLLRYRPISSLVRRLTGLPFTFVARRVLRVLNNCSSEYYVLLYSLTKVYFWVVFKLFCGCFKNRFEKHAKFVNSLVYTIIFQKTKRNTTRWRNVLLFFFKDTPFFFPFLFFLFSFAAFIAEGPGP